MLKNPDMLTAPFGEGYAALEARSGRQFPNVRFALRYLPVANDGDWHARLRKLASGFMQTHAATLQDIRRQAVLGVGETFSRTGEIDLMADLVEPMVTDLVERLSGTRFRFTPSMVFDHHLSLRKRLALEEEFGRVIARIRSSFPDEDDDQVGMRLAFAILGTDATLGTFGKTLARVFAPARSTRIGDLDWPDILVETGVPFILRDAAHEGVLEDQTATHERVYVDMTRFLDDGANPGAIFGVGAHTCLGRGFTQSLWRDMVGTFRSVDASASFKSVDMPELRIFDIPTRILIEVHP